MSKAALWLTCASMLGVPPAWAQVSRDGAAAIVASAHGDRVLSVQKAEDRERAVWRVKLVTSRGEVKVILIDVVSGRES